MFQWLIRLDQKVRRYMILAAPVSLLAGVIFPQVFSRLLPAVPWAFAAMTFCGSLGSSFRQLGEEFRCPRPLLVVLLILHVVLPLAAWGAGNLFFSHNPYFITGMLLEYSIPTAVASLMWIGIYQGSNPLGLAVLMTDVVISPFTIPLTLRLLSGLAVEVDAWGMVADLLLMVTLPALGAMGVNHLSRGQAGKVWSPRLSLLGKVCMVIVVSANSTKVAPYFANLTPDLVAVAAAIFSLTLLGYLLGWLAAGRLGLTDAQSKTCAFCCGLRNISAGVVIAAQYFPPDTLFPVIVGTLFQQFLAAVFGHLLTFCAGKGRKAGKNGDS